MLTKSYVNAQKSPLVNLIQISAKALNVSFLDLPLGGRTLCTYSDMKLETR